MNRHSVSFVEQVLISFTGLFVGYPKDICATIVPMELLCHGGY